MFETSMGSVRIHQSSHNFATQSSHSVDLSGWLAKMASIEQGSKNLFSNTRQGGSERKLLVTKMAIKLKFQSPN